MLRVVFLLEVGPLSLRSYCVCVHKVFIIQCLCTLLCSVLPQSIRYSIHFSAAEKHAQHEAADTTLHFWDGQVMRGAWVSSRYNNRIGAIQCCLGFIRPENLVSHSLSPLSDFMCLLMRWGFCLSTLTWSTYHYSAEVTVKVSSISTQDLWSSEWPLGIWSHLLSRAFSVWPGINTMKSSGCYKLLSCKNHGGPWEHLMQQKYFCSLPQEHQLKFICQRKVSLYLIDMGFK